MPLVVNLHALDAVHLRERRRCGTYLWVCGGAAGGGRGDRHACALPCPDDEIDEEAQEDDCGHCADGDACDGRGRECVWAEEVFCERHGGRLDEGLDEEEELEEQKLKESE